MCAFKVKDKYKVGDLVALVERLRDPESGCPWDIKQTHESMRQNFLEETCEVMEAIDRGDPELLREELGDVLLQVAMHARIEQEKGAFDIDDVADGVCKKLVLRHPHIFGDVTADDSETVLKNWEDIKRREKHQKTGLDAVSDVPRAMPSLMRSQKVQKRAGYVGFDYGDVGGALRDLKSEVSELERAAASGEGVEEELGDVIFSAVNVARLEGIDAELSAERACDKFISRFKEVERLAREEGVDMKTCDADKLDELWRRAKEVGYTH